MRLGPGERILLLSILQPAEGNAFFLREVRKLRYELAFSGDEKRDWNIQLRGEAWSWQNAEPKEIDITGSREYVAGCLRAASDAGRLHEGLLDLYEQVVQS